MPVTLQQIVIEMYEAYLKEINKYLDNIKRALQQHPDALEITKTAISNIELARKAIKQEPLPAPYQITPSGIEFLFASNQVYETIKEDIPKSITFFKAPKEFFPSVQELATFPNLESFERTAGAFSEEELAFLANHTKIKKVYTSNMFNISCLLDGKENIIGIKEPIEKYMYHNLTISSKSPSQSKSTTLRAVVHDSKDLPKLEELIESSSINWDDINTVVIKDSENINNKKTSTWNTPFITVKLNEEKSPEELEINTDNYEVISTLLKTAKERNYPLKKVTLHIQNRTDPKLAEIESYASQWPIEVDYGDILTAPIEDFSSMRASIDWYKDIMSERGLSPFEKVIFAYDIVKSFTYHENEESSSNSRYLTNIIKTGDIVCVGYAKMLSQILTELGIPATDFGLSTIDENDHSVGHARAIVHLDDNKYNIHGLFTLDPTWDSIREHISVVTDSEGKKQIRYTQKEGDSVQKEYDDLTLYRNFLIPYKDYETIYPEDTLPQFFTEIKREENEKTTDPTFQKGCDTLFPSTSWEEIRATVLESEKPSLESFAQALTTVRECEGYQKPTLSKVVNDVVELNSMVEKLYDKPQTFFAPEQKKK